ncbi:MAG: SDR family NAD(P)-dependent oxidoreductase [Kineosporiaceae bacterium]
MSTGRVVLVTGANRGIGREVARRCAARGDVVLLGSRGAAAGEEAADRLRREDSSLDLRPLRLDVTRQDDVDRAVERIRAETGRLDIVVNNAAIHYDSGATAAAADLTTVAEAMATNVVGAWRVAVAVVPLLATGGRLVNVSSGAGSFAETAGSGGAPAYSVSKAALNMLTVKLAADLRPRRILVNAVCPGWVATDMGGPGGRPVADGAASVMFAVDLPDGGPTGGFFRDGRPVPW